MRDTDKTQGVFLKHLKIVLSFAVLLAFSSANANVVGADTHNFNPLVNGVDFVTVKSSETLDPGQLNMGLFIDYAANSLPSYKGVSGVKVEPDDTLLHMDIHAALGLTNWWDIGFNVANVLQQDTSVEEHKGFFSDKGLTDYMLYTKIRFLGNDQGGAALAVSVNLPQTKNSPFLGFNSPAPSHDYNEDPIYNIELVLDKDFGMWAAGLNLGYRVRSPGVNKSAVGLPGDSRDGEEVDINPIPDQFLASAALSKKFNDKTRIIGEIYASFLADDPVDVGGDGTPSATTTNTLTQTSEELSTAEFLLGLRHDFRPNIHWHIGAATSILDGTSSPDWRVYTGLNFRFGLWGGAAAAPVVVEEVVEEIIEEPVIEEPYIEEPIVEEPVIETPPMPIVTDINDTDVFKNSTMQKVEIYSFRNLNFRTNSAKIPSEFKPRLAELTEYVNRPPAFTRLIVHGHTDSRGSANYNLALSQRRADMVRKALILAYGLPADKIAAIGHGEDQPIADNLTPEGLLANRRVEFEIMR